MTLLGAIKQNERYLIIFCLNDTAGITREVIINFISLELQPPPGPYVLLVGGVLQARHLLYFISCVCPMVIYLGCNLGVLLLFPLGNLGQNLYKEY